MKAKTKQSVFLSIMVGVICSLLISTFMLVGLTNVVIKGKIGIGVSGLLIHFVRFTAVLIGVILSTLLVKDNYLITSGAVTIGYVLLLGLLCVLIYDSSFYGFWIGVLSSVLGGGAGMLIGLKLQHRPRSRVRFNK